MLKPRPIFVLVAAILVAVAISVAFGGLLESDDSEQPDTATSPAQARVPAAPADQPVEAAPPPIEAATEATQAVAVAAPSARDTQDSEALLDELLTGLASGDTAAYAAGLEARLDTEPGDEDALALLGLAYQQLARETADPTYYAQAGRTYDRAQDVDPDHALAAIGQASLAVIRHEFAAGVELAERALELSPRNASAYAILGDALLELGEYPKAFENIEQAALLSPTVGTYARIASVRELLGRPDDALAAIELALELDRGVPEHRAWTLVEGGNIARRAGRTARALRMYREALDEVPGYVHARAALAARAAENGNHAAAARRYERVTQELPLPAYFIALAHSLEAIDRSTDAQRAFDRAAEIIDTQQDNGVQTQLAEAELLLARGADPSRALELAREGYAAAPNVDAEATLADALLENQRCGQARTHSIRALRLGTHNTAAFEQRSQIEACLGNDRASARWLERAAAPARS